MLQILPVTVHTKLLFWIFFCEFNFFVTRTFYHYYIWQKLIWGAMEKVLNVLQVNQLGVFKVIL